MIIKGYEWLIEKEVVKIDATLFLNFINSKIEELEPLDDSKIGGVSSVKKTHTISKEMLIELRLEEYAVKIPYTYIEKKKNKLHFRYESKKTNVKVVRNYKFDKKNRIQIILDCLLEC